MKTMEDYVCVRKLRHINGLSLREISRQTGFHRDTIKKILSEGAASPYRRKAAPLRPVLGPFTPIIDQILSQDRQAPRKQRHSARRIWQRLKEEYGYRGGYTQVGDYVRQTCERQRESFVPLAFEPATAQVDWGEAWAWQDGQRRKVQGFVMTLPVSGARFVALFPRQTLEFFLEGHRRAFRFFGGVPRWIIYDNLKSAVVQVKRGRGRVLNRSFEAFANHHLFEPRFCNVAKGNEKGHVENGVKWMQKTLLTPLPHFSDWGLFNAHIAQACRHHLERRTERQETSAAQRLNEERPHLLPLPPRAEPLGKKETWTVSSVCLVRFDNNDYSVPCEFAHRRVVVQADVAEVRIYAHETIDEQAPLLAVHRRCHERFRAVYDPLHYLPLVARKPRTLDDGAPMQQLQAQLPECFDVLRRRMERGQIHSRGTRDYIVVLLLLKKYRLARLTQAVGRALQLGVEHPEAIKHLLLTPPEASPATLSLVGRPHLAGYGAPPPPLSHYAELVTMGGAS